MSYQFKKVDSIIKPIVFPPEQILEINEAGEVTEAETKEEAKKEETSHSPHEQILKEYGGIESNIPIKHIYWKIRP